MALEADPYRILELPRGASLDEVKRAYRRLAKVHHPDAAGEAALPRFLAIQAAYEQLLGGSDPSVQGRRGSSAPRRPWDADPDRSDATRRAYGGRARNAPPGTRSTPPKGGGAASGGTGGTPPRSGNDPAGGTGGTGAAGTPGGTGATGRSRPASGRARPGQASGPSGSASGGTGRRRPSGSRAGPGTPPSDASSRPPGAKRNKATLGSTSYDGAGDGPFEPDWGGASWYGTTSGTYWTLNPKEYADPRKHGPEYQARARRAARARAPDPRQEDPEATDPRGADAANDAAEATTGPRHSTSSWWDSTAGPAASAPFGDGTAPTTDRGAGPDAHRPAGPAAQAAPPPPDLGRAAADITHALTDDRFGGVRGRVIRAIIGWLPIALGIGWVVGELTGCGRFAATCDGATEPFVLLLQVGALALLLLVPALASLATTAAVALFVAAVAAALVLSATGSAADGEARRATLGAVLLVAWLVGLAVAVMRRVRAVPSPTRPVS